MLNENVFMNRVIELVDSSKTQRDGVGTTLVEEFNLPGKHTVTRLVERLLGISISKMLKLKFEYPDTWKTQIPKLNLINDVSLADRVEQLRKGGYTFKTAKEILLQEYSISEMELVRRIRSICQKSMSEIFEPTDSEIQDALIRANTVDEFWELLGTDNLYRGSFFEKRLGVSNFRTAKTTCLYKIKIPNINPCTADNEAMIFSQILGDGSFDKERKALKIAHGIKQLEYLRWKVSMLQNAYPTLKSMENVKILMHTQGHEYASWYSGRLPDHIVNKIETFTYEEMVHALTPLGMLWLFLDDGCLYWQDTKVITISNGKDKNKHQIISNYLSTYNIHSIAYETTCTIAQKVEIVKFLNTFVKPYINIIPQCMLYKTEIMI